MAEGRLILVEEYFSSGDPRFLDELGNLYLSSGKTLGPLAERWVKDSRPWAREQLHYYLDRPLRCPGHEPLVKKLFKAAEAAQDDALMARFLAAFDRGIRREQWKAYNWATRETVERLGTPRVTVSRSDSGPRRLREMGRLFKVHTRQYLRRRAWRYFRRIGYRDPNRYLAAVLKALPLYRDEDVPNGVHFLDNWGLMHVLFHHSDVVFYKTHGWFVRGGRALRELKPAPAFPKAWENASAEVFELLASAKSRPVRRAAMAMLKARPDWTQKVLFERVLRLLRHDDEELQALGVDLLGSASGLESVPVALWMELLELKSLAVLEAVCGVMAKIVGSDRFTTEQLLGFACGPLGPVAKLGLDWLRKRDLSPAQFVELAQVRASSVAADVVAFARERLSAAPDFNSDWLLAFLDAPLREARLCGAIYRNACGSRLKCGPRSARGL